MRLAIIDEEVQSMLLRFPSVLRELVSRVEQRANTLALQLALAQMPRLEARMLALPWHLADRSAASSVGRRRAAGAPVAGECSPSWSTRAGPR